MMIIISILLTILIAGIIGWQAKMKQFPFNGFKWVKAANILLGYS